jgi:hypothetical protein
MLTNYVIPGDLSGRTLPPGTYSAPAALTTSGTVFLQHGANPSASVWNFFIGSAFMTMESSDMQFKNDNGVIIVDDPSDALKSQVTWEIIGAITLAAKSIAVGNMQSTHGAITTGADAVCDNLYAPLRAITVGAAATAGILDAGRQNKTTHTLRLS